MSSFSSFVDVNLLIVVSIAAKNRPKVLYAEPLKGDFCFPMLL